MPCIWGQHNGAQLFCQVAVLLPNNTPLPHGGVLPVVKTARALIDTGATTTCITSALATHLNLAPVGKINVQGVSGVVAHNSYLFQIGFPFLTSVGGVLPVGLPAQASGQVHVLGKLIHGFEFNAGSAAFEVLLGMDVLATGSLVVQGNDTFSFSF